MTTAAPRICRTCGAEVKENKGSRFCPNGCQIYTARPIGDQYMNARSIERDDAGRLWETGGAAGNIRRLPTCDE